MTKRKTFPNPFELGLNLGTRGVRKLFNESQPPPPKPIKVELEVRNLGLNPPTNTTPEWERGKNEAQLRVVRWTTGPVAVLAGAGSGKTGALTSRIAKMVLHDEVPGNAILAVTFSKKAADEMNARVERFGVRSARVGTWHSLALEILKQDQTRWATWEIDDKDRAKLLLKEAIGFRRLNFKNGDPEFGALRQWIGLCKAHNAIPFFDKSAELARSFFHGAHAVRRAGEAYDLFQTLLQEKGLLTFDDMLMNVVSHLQDETTRTSWSNKWQYVIQDEAQDASPVQCLIAEALSKDHRNYMVVGDFSQSIYQFRGADPKILLNFAREWSAETITMATNYRSTTRVVETANAIISFAASKPAEPMTPARAQPGSVEAMKFADLDDEANSFAAWVKIHVKEGGNYADNTAIFRTNAQSRALEEALLSNKIPYLVVGGTSFYERREVTDLLAYLRVADGNPRDGDVKRCINTPFRFLGARFVEKLTDISATYHELTWPARVLRAAELSGTQYRQQESARDWANLITDIAGAISKGTAPSIVLGSIIERTKFIEAIEKEEGADSIESSRAANIRELTRVAEKFTSVRSLLDYVDKSIEAARKQRLRDADAPQGNRVLLMSIHRSKGLEWPRVWVSGVNEKVLPHARGDLEEERRLAYVAITRARDELVLAYVERMSTSKGVGVALPSRFLVETGMVQDEYEEECSDEGAYSV